MTLIMSHGCQDTYKINDYAVINNTAYIHNNLLKEGVSTITDALSAHHTDNGIARLLQVMVINITKNL